MISDAAIESVNASLVEVIQSRIELRPRGRKFYALCPFHQDNSPSFEVNPFKSAWFCNVCNLAGDAISFIEKFHNVDFLGAVKILGLKKESVPDWKQKRFSELKSSAETARDQALNEIEERFILNAALSRQTNLAINENSAADLNLEMLRLDTEFDALKKEREFVLEVFQERMAEIRQAVLS